MVFSVVHYIGKLFGRQNLTPSLGFQPESWLQVAEQALSQEEGLFSLSNLPASSKLRLVLSAVAAVTACSLVVACQRRMSKQRHERNLETVRQFYLAMFMASLPSVLVLLILLRRFGGIGNGPGAGGNVLGGSDFARSTAGLMPSTMADVSRPFERSPASLGTSTALSSVPLANPFKDMSRETMSFYATLAMVGFLFLTASVFGGGAGARGGASNEFQPQLALPPPLPSPHEI